MRENPELLNALVKVLPLPFLTGLKEMIPRLYMEAQEASAGDPLIGAPEVEYIVPHYRRVLIEKAVRDLAESTKMHATVLQNSKRSAKYTLIKSGNFLFTVSYVNEPSGQVRVAEFRNSHSQVNKLLSQKSFEGFEAHESIEKTDSPIYCLLLHGTDFMKWAVPHPNGTGWIAEFDFSTVFQAASDIGSAKQADGANPTLKKDQDEGTGGE